MPSSVPPAEVRPFRREDRDQLTDLVNAHAAAVVPGVSASVNTVLSSLERRPDEFVTNPWVAEKLTWVLEADQRIVGAAHLLRYRDTAEVGEDYRDSGELSWFIFLPDAGEAAGLLMSAVLAQFGRWSVRVRYADGLLPVPGVVGVPEPWPHVRSALERAGFVHTGDTEILLLARVTDLPAPSPAPLPGLSVNRTVGDLGTRLTARLDGEDLASLELDTSLERAERHARSGGLADLSDLNLPDDADPALVRWLLGQAREWLELCGVGRLLVSVYEGEDDARERDTLLSLGFRELTRTARGWRHTPSGEEPAR
ncbi:GNAT family N-acetyltransferase [Streptomyces sp. NPDC057638]|uniref:GNAT family N-acetyltransferase n=1 Tax=Streptomyces sp. NPDC057638 TaxID=3346190 RepID=UPI00369B6002